MTKKRWLSSLFALSMTALALCSGSFTSLANDASDFYKDVYDGNKAIVGDSIPSGYYCLYNKKDNKNASYSIKSGTYVLISDSFRYNEIVYVEDDDILYLTNCYAVPLENARINPVEECMVEVGEHIKEGKYKLEFMRGSSNSATCTVYDSLDFHDEEDDDTDIEDLSETTKISNGSDTEIELKDGQFVKLSGCRLIDVDDDDDK